ncbi:hypothetical protein [Paracraurococcus lichenis]|uniref:DUF4365 domain-containing protein n=1 Tax=Paracraurococcus lichenis TaxID=3064888 RepID=A0ABT9E979_9PROT|nr:hypothetical protein [Paracraurococcus sp. LOR1-02]MDO9712538.1 hypothetical protein [Paracraurococcus sp. LOR1-02]MDO9713244.1 hypothetical protein [Paracraurococcus sp. LOR1-02]
MKATDLLLHTASARRRLSLDFITERFVEAGFSITRLHLGSRRIHFLRGYHPAGRTIDVWVRSTRESNKYVAIPKAQMDPAPGVYVALIWLRFAQEPQVYLIPSRRWLDRSSPLLLSYDRPDPQGSSAWLLRLDASRLEPYRFELTLAKLLHGT